jgi:hypothetical protein
LGGRNGLLLCDLESKKIQAVKPLAELESAGMGLGNGFCNYPRWSDIGTG